MKALEMWHTTSNYYLFIFADQQLCGSRIFFTYKYSTQRKRLILHFYVIFFLVIFLGGVKFFKIWLDKNHKP